MKITIRIERENKEGFRNYLTIEMSGNLDLALDMLNKLIACKDIKIW